MKRTVDFTDFREAFARYGRADQFSGEALHLIFAHQESLEEGLGEQFELDVVAICCEYTEYATLNKLREAFSYLDFDGVDPEDFQAIVDRIDRVGPVLWADPEGPFVHNG